MTPLFSKLWQCVPALVALVWGCSGTADEELAWEPCKKSNKLFSWKFDWNIIISFDYVKNNNIYLLALFTRNSDAFFTWDLKQRAKKHILNWTKLAGKHHHIRYCKHSTCLGVCLGTSMHSSLGTCLGICWGTFWQCCLGTLRQVGLYWP